MVDVALNFATHGIIHLWTSTIGLIGNGYQKGPTVDRINNDGNYEPANCRLVYVIDQHNNNSDQTDI